MGFRLGAHMGARLGGWLVIGVAGTAIAADGLPPLRVDPALIGAPNPVKPANPASAAAISSAASFLAFSLYAFLYFFFLSHFFNFCIVCR